MPNKLDKQLAAMRTPKYLEKRAIDQLKALPQPVTINGGGYAYSANVKKSPYKWQASDGSPITITKLAELGDYFEKYVQEEWNAFLEDEQDAEDLIQLGYLRTGAAGAYKGQADFEGQALRGNASNPDAPEIVIWRMGQDYRANMRAALKHLGIQAEWAGYDAGSTLWAVLFYNEKRQTLSQLEDAFRDALNFDGWMEVEDGSEYDAMFDSVQPTEPALNEADDHEWTAHRIGRDIYSHYPDLDVNYVATGTATFEPPDIYSLALSQLTSEGWPRKKIDAWLNRDPDFFQDIVNSYVYYQKNPTGAALESRETNMNEDADMTRLLKLAGMYHKPQVFEMEDNKEGDQSPLSDVTDFVADIRGEKPKDPEKFDNADGEKSILSENDPNFQKALRWATNYVANNDELAQEYADEVGQPVSADDTFVRGFAEWIYDNEFGGFDARALEDEEWKNEQAWEAGMLGGIDAYNEIRGSDADPFDSELPQDFDNEREFDDEFEEGIEEAEVDEDYLEPPHQKDPHANEEADDWYDPEDARRQMARMGANPEFTGRHELKPHDPVADQAREDEWIMNQNAEQEQMAAMDDWDVFNKQGVDEEGELGNGYGDHHVVNGDDLFPQGGASNPPKKVGPAGARHGNNPMSQTMATESAKIFEQYTRDFEDFKKK